jgi:hypothetical protein
MNSKNNKMNSKNNKINSKNNKMNSKNNKMNSKKLFIIYIDNIINFFNKKEYIIK